METIQQETEQKIASHKQSCEVENIVGSLVSFAVAAELCWKGKGADVEFQDRWLAVKKEHVAAPVHSSVSLSDFQYISDAAINLDGLQASEAPPTAAVPTPVRCAAVPTPAAFAKASAAVQAAGAAPWFCVVDCRMQFLSGSATGSLYHDISTPG